MQVLPDKIVIDAEDWTTGFAPGFGSANTLYIGPGNTYLQNFNPYTGALTSGIVGVASPGPNPADVTTVATIDELLKGKAIYRGATNYLYAVGKTKVHRASFSGANLTVSDDAGVNWPKTVSAHGGHGAVTLWDCIVYTHKVSSTNRQDLFYSWDDVNDGDVGILKASDGSANNASYMSATPSGAARLTGARPHPMIIGDDGILYIGNGATVAAYDGQNGTDGVFSGNVIDLPADFVITSFAKDSSRNLLVIYAYNPVGNTPMSLPDGDATYRGDSYAFFWDYVSPSFLVQVNLDDSYVNGGFIYKSMPACFTWGRGINFVTTSRAKLRVYDGRTFQTLAVPSGNPPGHAGVEVAGDLIFWNSDGAIWQYGPVFPGFPRALNQITSGAGTTNGGILINTSDNTFHASTGTGTSGGLQKVTPANFHSTATFQSLTVEPQMQGHRRCEVTRVKTYFAATATGGRSLAMSLVTDKGGTTTTVFTGVTDVTASGGETATSKNMISEAVMPSTGKFPQFSDLRCNLVWSTGSGATSAPVVSRIEIYYKPVNIKS